MLRYQEGEGTRFPLYVRMHMVAARYGTTVAAVREWPADDYVMAENLLPITGGR